MPKKSRLSRADFIKLPRSSRRVHGNFFSLVAIPAEYTPGPRAACVVSKKIAVRAVDRNKIERRCREALRPHMSQIKKSIALIFHAKREARDASYAEIVRDVEKLLSSVAGQDTTR